MICLDLKKYKTQDISFYLALEEYLTNINNNDYFFLWDIDRSIIVGKNQIINTEVNLDFVNKYGFKVYRRPSGGGAIYGDNGDFMYSFISRNKTKDEMYDIFINKFVKALKDLNLDVKLSGRNDLTFLDKKFSGSAIYFKNNHTILHGTFLYDSDLTLLEKFLTPDNDKLLSKGIISVKSRVINLKEYINLDKDSLMDYLLHNISNDITIRELNSNEFIEVLEIKKKFDDNNYINKTSIPYTFHNKIKTKSGIIEIYIDIKNNIIKNIDLVGDFFINKDINDLYSLFIGININDINKIIEKIKIKDYIIDLENNEFIELFK